MVVDGSILFIFLFGFIRVIIIVIIGLWKTKKKLRRGFDQICSGFTAPSLMPTCPP